MSKFIPRLKIPESGNPYYNRKPAGYNPCILGNNNRGQRVKGLNNLPNCVGYSVGRFNEVGGQGNCNLLGSKNPVDMIPLARKQGLKISKEPTLGGVMVWSGGPGNLGHVANVEAKFIDLVVTSESEWYALPFTLYKRKIGLDGNYKSGCYWMERSNYRYEGCIVNPYVKEEEEMLTYEQFKEYLTQYLKERAEDNNTWATIPIKEVEKLGIMKGDGNGFHPNSWVTRAELSQVAVNLIDLLSK